MTPNAVPYPAVARAPALQWVRTVELFFKEPASVFSYEAAHGYVF